MTQRGNERVAARQRARERRLALDADRLAREDRIDAAVGDYELVRADYAAAQDALHAAELKVAAAVAAVLAEGEPAERVAALCEITPAEIRRLAKLAGAVEQPSSGRQPRQRASQAKGSTPSATDRDAAPVASTAAAAADVA